MSKALVVLIAALPAAVLAADPADVPAGAVELSGDTALSFSSGSVTLDPDVPGVADLETDIREYAFSATALYYVARNVAVGLAARYENQTQETGPDDERSWTLLVGPAVSAQLPVAPSLALFGRGAVGYARSRAWGEEVPDLKGSGYGFTVQGGARYFPMPRVSIDLGIGYTRLTLTTDETTTPTFAVPEIEATTSGIDVTAGLSVFFGR